MGVEAVDVRGCWVEAMRAGRVREVEERARAARGARLARRLSIMV